MIGALHAYDEQGGADSAAGSKVGSLLQQAAKAAHDKSWMLATRNDKLAPSLSKTPSFSRGNITAAATAVNAANSRSGPLHLLSLPSTTAGSALGPRPFHALREQEPTPAAILQTGGGKGSRISAGSATKPEPAQAAKAHPCQRASTAVKASTAGRHANQRGRTHSPDLEARSAAKPYGEGC
jgi:hypothetical protein